MQNNIIYAEEIINYHYRFYGNYYNIKEVMDFISKTDYKERMFYVIECCNKENPDKREQMLLALAYSALPKEYTEYALKYLHLYLEDKRYYLKDFTYGMNKTDCISYQWYLFYKLLAIKYDDDLMYDKALHYIDLALHTNPKVRKDYDEPYELYATILYHKNDIKSAISILRRGSSETNNDYNRKRYLELIGMYEDYLNNNKIYKPQNRKRPRLDTETNQLYDLTSGELIQ